MTAVPARHKFYGWYMVIFNLLVLASGTGLVNNSAGQFLKPLTQALGISRAEANFYSACMTLTMIVMVPQLPKLFRLLKPRTLSSFGVLCIAGGWFSISLAQSKWHLYVCAVFIGLGLSFTGTAMVSIIISNWFIKNKGKALGLALIGSAVGGTIYNPVCAALIQNYGFRSAYQITAVILFCGMIPYLIGYAFKPEDKNQMPLGLENDKPAGAATGPAEPKKELKGMTWEEAKHSPLFYKVCFIALVLNICAIGIYTQLQAYLNDLGYQVILAASVVSIVSLCNGFAKIFFGWLDDKLGTKVNYIAALSVMFLGMLLLLFAQAGIVFVYIAAVLFGLGLSSPTVITPMVTMATLGQKHFPALYSRIASFFYLGATCGPLISGIVHDLTGSYRAAIILYMVLVCITAIIGSKALALKKAEG